MRTILTELWPIEDHAPYGMGVSIGVEGEPHVANLTEGGVFCSSNLMRCRLRPSCIR